MSSSYSSPRSSKSYRELTPWVHPAEMPAQSTPNDSPDTTPPVTSLPYDRENGVDVTLASSSSSRRRGPSEEGEYSSERWQEASIESPILVSPKRASDYAKMSMSSATPPPSDAGITTYMSKAVEMVKRIHKLPWMVGSGRVTADYYPEKQETKPVSEREEDLYERRSKGITSASWKSQKYIEWRRRHYGHVASSSDTVDSVVESSAGVIEPFRDSTHV